MDEAKLTRCHAWLAQLELWCVRHKISTESALSILFADNEFQGAGKPDAVTARNLHWAEANEFAEWCFLRRGLKPFRAIGDVQD